MDLTELNDYEEWIDKSPDVVLKAVKGFGGWDRVFEKKPFPCWASRVHNYFNETPLTLKRLAKDVSDTLTERAQTFIFAFDCNTVRRVNREGFAGHPLPAGAQHKLPRGCATVPEQDLRLSLSEVMAARKALSGDVYLDEFNRIWFQMSAGATIYHWGSDVKSPKREAIWAEKIKGQANIPVFKLVSPDGSGGSRECIVKNPFVVPIVEMGRIKVMQGKTTIGGVHETVAVVMRIVREPKYQGSYNYSETIEKGFAAHELRDVTPHRSRANFYVDPPPDLPLSNRRFPRNDPQGRPVVADDCRR
jgi:hypothetical protein